MKRYFLATLATMALAGGSANAADLARPMPRVAPAPVAAVYKWTGPYWGVNVGYSWGRVKNEWTLTTGLGTFIATETQDIDGVIGGVQSGINWQWGIWVWGMEHDLQISGQKGDAAYCVNLTCTTNAVVDHKLAWFGTARSRLGFLWSDWVLVYGTAGVAYGQVRSDYALATGVTPVAVLNFKETRAGYAVGAGAEAAFGGGWSGKIEYLYIDLGKYEVNAIAPTGAILTWNKRVYDHIARVGLNFRWN